MTPHKIVYTSDVHGNEVQYQKLVEYALKNKADSVIIGGDIAPKGKSVTASLEELRKKGLPLDNFIAMQHLFFKRRLPQLVSTLKEKGIPLFIMMGNDDCQANLPVFEKGEEEGFYQIIHGRRLPLTPDFDIVGYACVPITPFGIKDWEKYDFSKTPEAYQRAYEERKRINYRLDGGKSSLKGWQDFIFDTEIEKSESLQNDLAQPVFTANTQKTLYVIHTPPDNTALDQVHGGNHVGSMALRDFIERKQPYLTLHGHIHETVEISGKFQEIIGKTRSISSGNHNVGKKLAVIVFDAYHPEKAERIII